LGFIVKVTVMLLLLAAILYYLPAVLDVTSSWISWLRSYSQIAHTFVFDGANLL
jgi:hypothetical protein